MMIQILLIHFTKKQVKNSGVDLSFIKSYVPMLFGKIKKINLL